MAEIRRCNRKSRCGTQSRQTMRQPAAKFNVAKIKTQDLRISGEVSIPVTALPTEEK
jgi:hypothetical protein